jgi:hypothetical protein
MPKEREARSARVHSIRSVQNGLDESPAVPGFSGKKTAATGDPSDGSTVRILPNDGEENLTTLGLLQKPV